MPARQHLPSPPAPQVRLSRKIASYLFCALLLSSLGIILTKIVTDPDPARQISQVEVDSPSP